MNNKNKKQTKVLGGKVKKNKQDIKTKKLKDRLTSGKTTFETLKNNLKQDKSPKKFNNTTKKVDISNGSNSKMSKVKRKNKLPTKNTKKAKVTSKRNESDNGDSTMEISNVDFEKADEMLVKAKKKKLDDSYKKEVEEHLLFNEDSKRKKKKSNDKNKIMKPVKVTKKEKLKKMLETNVLSNRTSVKVSGNKLRDRMLERLKGTNFSIYYL